MKAYGLTKMQVGDDDVGGCREIGRKTSIYSINGRAYRSLRGGKKAKIRRVIKRVARQEGKKLCIV